MLDQSWKRWIAENKLLGATDAEIAEIVQQKLGNTTGVAEAISEIEISPAFLAGQLVADRLRKLESLARNMHKVQAVAPNAQRIDRRHKLSARDFFIDYYARNTPVIITGLMEAWPALTCWTYDYLKAHCGTLDIEVMLERDTSPDYELKSHSFKQRMTFSDYIDRMKHYEGNECYLVANNGFFKQTGTHALLQDFAPLAGFQDPREMVSHTNFWLGPKGTVTPLHHDPANILFMQIWGEKLFKLISPLQSPDMYNYIGVFSEVDAENPDFDRHPQFANCTVIEEVVGPGDVLFIPVGWWHHVRGLSATLSLSSTSFTQPNQFVWHYPKGR
jgi:ribosomal protein L16 Arg81 hydroxylase